MPAARSRGFDPWELARITHGFVGADLEALCREAAMACLRRILPDIDFAQPALPYPMLTQLEPSRADFEAALREVEPSALREVFVEVPTMTWDDIGGLAGLKLLLQEAIGWPLQYRELFDAFDVQPPKGILLSGPPGCGKTLLAQAAASMSQTNFIAVKGPALLSKYVGESESGVREVFRKAKQAAPCLVFFDEIDALVPKRESSESHVSERVVGQFLAELDGVEKLSGVLILAATNRPDIIDPALLRPGRFDVHVTIGLPDASERLAVLLVHTRKKRLATGLSMEEFASSRTEGLTGADLAAICQRAALHAIRERVAGGGAIEGDALVHRRHFEAALQDINR